MTYYSGFSAGLDQSILYVVLGFTTGTFVAPAGVCVSLHYTAIGTAKVFTNEWTVVGTNYVRMSAANTTTLGGTGSANWDIATFVAGTGVIAGNHVQIAFPAASGTSFPINLSAVGFNDNITVGGGNLDWFADVTTQSVASGIQVAFFTAGAAGSDDIQFRLL